MMRIAQMIMVLGMTLAPLAAGAQGANVAFAGLKTDISQPVQVEADQLSVSQTDGTAMFSGNVVITQGDMRLEAGVVTIRYSADKKAIESLHAEGGVTLAAGTDAATADSAEYRPDTGDLTLIDQTFNVAQDSSFDITLAVPPAVDVADFDARSVLVVTSHRAITDLDLQTGWS